MSTPTADTLMKIGQLKKPYGIKGWLWVFSDTDERTAIFDMQPWWMKTAAGMKPLTVKAWREQGSGLVAQFEQVPDRNVAETMNGVTLWVEQNVLPETSDDEHYWSDLVGLRVTNEQNEYLGDIAEMFETGAHDIMRVAATSASLDSEERLIPWHKQTVLQVDTTAKTVVVAWPSDY
ncbi:ribosome maturation factor RimM [uncultured Psychrobacter sp.]|uniref:ribosome maturation factor RimM n=1 Tax=unclassified Psychrobacter TaxID=196806 RepID=UPI00293D1F1E|nr:ribosome maturation factor RimM [uncultured Psychrobacter sp.]